MIVCWIDLGCQIEWQMIEFKNGVFVDDKKFMFFVSLGKDELVKMIQIGVFDYFELLRKLMFCIRVSFFVVGWNLGVNLSDFFMEIDNVW